MTKRIHRLVTILTFCFMFQSIFAADIERINLSDNGEQANDTSYRPLSINADGRFIVYISDSTNLVANNINEGKGVFVYDRETNSTELVGVTSSLINGALYDSVSYIPSISADGRFVVFESDSSNLINNDTNNNTDIFVYDRNTGVTERVNVSSTGEQANDRSGLPYAPSISADGRYVVFTSYATNLVIGDTNDSIDVFIHDRETAKTKRLSVSSTGMQANRDAYSPSISADGRYVAFTSAANNLVDNDTDKTQDVFVHNRISATTSRISVSFDGRKANSRSYSPKMSTDGRFVIFSSFANNLVIDDSNKFLDAFVYDQSTGIIELVSKSSRGMLGDRDSVPTSISADGRFVTLRTNATNLVAGDNNRTSDVFVHDRYTDVTKRVSVSSSGEQGYRGSHLAAISADGQYIAFSSDARNLVGGDTNRFRDIFIAKRPVTELSNDLTVKLRQTSGATNVGEYIRFRAQLRNNSNTILTNCTAKLVNPVDWRLNYQRLYSYFSWPLNTINPVLNGSIDIAPGETGQIELGVLPRLTMRREISFEYVCDSTRAEIIPFVNTAHLVAKDEPLIAEDYVQVENTNNRTSMIIDRTSGKYWAAVAFNIRNTGNEPTSIKLTTTSFIPNTILRQSHFCEPLDPMNNNWSCISPREEQLLVNLNAGESKKIFMFVHAKQIIEKKTDSKSSLS